jgi:hypothetical protein
MKPSGKVTRLGIHKPLPEAEWDFRRLGEDELTICFLYEYGREHAKNSNRWRLAADRLKTLLADNRKERRGHLKSWSEMCSIFGNQFLHSFFDPSFVTTPWQSRDAKLRRQEAAEFNQSGSKPQSFQGDLGLSITLERDLPEYNQAGVADFESWVDLDRCFHGESHQREYGFLAVNWNYTDMCLIARFRKWLGDKRGDRKATESRQGRTKFRQHLKALGAKRLLDSGLTVADAIDHTEKIFKDHGSPGPLYDSDRAWSKAKNEIVPEVLKRLFGAAE